MNYCLVGTYRLQTVNTEVIYLTQEQKSKKKIEVIVACCCAIAEIAHKAKFKILSERIITLA